MESEPTLKSTLVNCISQQISEIEVLTSIYPNNEDIIFADASALKHMTDFVENRTDCLPNHLDFTLNLLIEGLKLEISFNLPSLYPNEEPDIYIRCNKLNRQQESSLNLDLTNYIKNNHLGEQCVYTAISWIQDNIGNYNNGLNELKNSVPIQKSATDKYSRLWIYSHHIYSKKKRDEIVKIAKDHNLTGFCLCGKPGIICVEGLECDCNDWWRIIKSLNWKKIMIRKTEIFNISEINTAKKFENFEEIHFQNTSKISKHPDMSSFSKYLEEIGLSEVFIDLFGLCST